MTKRFLFLALAGIAGWLANSSVATAGLIVPPPGSPNTTAGPVVTDSSGDLTTGPLGLVTPIGAAVINTGPTPYSFGGTPGNPADTGTIQEVVYHDATNPLGVGALTFLFQVNVTKGDIRTVTSPNFDAAIMTDVAVNPGVAPLSATGTRLPINADRLTGTAVDFNFNPLIFATDPNSESVALIIRTNGEGVVPGFIGLIEGGAQEVPGYGPTATPEPASVVLLGFGAAGLLGYGLKRRKVLA